MQKADIFSCKASFSFGNISDVQHDSRGFCTVPSLQIDRSSIKLHLMKPKHSSPTRFVNSDFLKFYNAFYPKGIACLANGSEGEIPDEEDELCPVECVREFKTDEEFLRILEKAKETGALVVVDFYRTACGSCKYIAQGFSKLCKGSGNQGSPVIFLKHNVIDEYDEESEVAERLRIRAVPLFHFYKDGVLLEAFATRDKERIDAAILKYTSPIPENA